MKKTLSFLILLTILIGCNSDDDNQNNDLVGNWKLEAFVNEADGTRIVPSDFENSKDINIDFKENNKFDIYTVRNEFFGDYLLNESNNLLILKNFFGTQVGETDWGYFFLDNLALNYNHSTKNWDNKYELSNTILKIYYSESEYMEFKRI